MKNGNRNFMNLLQKRWTHANSLVCVGLDSEYLKLPQSIKKKFSSPFEVIFEFNKRIIDNTSDLVCAYKPQYAFYGAQGEEGINALKRTIDYIHEKYSDVPVILDAKRNDIGSTATAYAQEIFEVLNADAVTVTPYLGFDGVEPFINYKDRGTIILCRTSNPSAKDFQDIVDKRTNNPLYQLVAQQAKTWDTNHNICLVVGATYPEEMKTIRKIVGDSIPFLVPGLGAQGGKPEDLPNGFDKDKTGIIANSSRRIIFAGNGENFAEKARDEAKKLRDEINKYR